MSMAMKFSDIKASIINGIFVVKLVITYSLKLLLAWLTLCAYVFAQNIIFVACSTTFKTILKLILSPLILLNYCAVKFAIFLIQHKSLNVFNLRYENLLNKIPFIMSVQKIMLLLAVLFFAPTELMFSYSLFVSILAIIVRDVVIISLFIAIDNVISDEHDNLMKMLREARNNLWYLNSEIRHKILLAAENMNAKELLDYLQEFTTEFPKQYIWNNFYEEVFVKLNLKNSGPWKNLDKTTLEYLENKFENSELYCYLQAGLKNVPVKVFMGDRIYSYDLFLLLRRMHTENGVLREHSNEAVKYSDITLDTANINLIKQITSKATGLKSPIFKQLFNAAQTNNNYQEMLKFLQQAEQKYPLELGALYWTDELQQAWKDYENTALTAEGKSKQHRCSMTLKIMQNPCYIVDPNDPSKRNYFELMHMLKWVSDHNTLPITQDDADHNSENNQATPRLLLSQVYYDAELKATLDECYHQKPNPGFTPRFSTPAEPNYIPSRVNNMGRALANVL